MKQHGDPPPRPLCTINATSRHKSLSQRTFLLRERQVKSGLFMIVLQVRDGTMHCNTLQRTATNINTLQQTSYNIPSERATGEIGILQKSLYKCGMVNVRAYDCLHWCVYCPSVCVCVCVCVCVYAVRASVCFPCVCVCSR